MTLLTLVSMAALGSSPSGGPGALEAETQAWHAQRIANLKSENGWLTLVGLAWMKEGANAFGAAPDNDLVFPKGTPPHLGTATLHAGAVTVRFVAGATVLKEGKPFSGGVLKPDTDELRLGGLTFFVIQRQNRFGFRIKDREAAARRDFHGIDRFPVSPAWKVEARFEPAAAPRTLSVPNVLGTVEDTPSPGTAVFTVRGAEYRLDPIEEDGKLFFVFGDESNGDTSYGAGRFLYTPLPHDGKVTLDFNRAFNPPCAFSAFATCPLPPRQNRLKLRVEAGEKRYGHP